MRIFELQPRVTENDFCLGIALREQREIARVLGNVGHQRVDFIIGECLARLHVACHCSRAEANNCPVAMRHCLLSRGHYRAGWTGARVIGEGFALMFGSRLCVPWAMAP